MDDNPRFSNWQYPEIEEGIPTKYQWLVQHLSGLSLGHKTDIGAFTYINARFGVVIENEVQIGSHCSLYSISTIDNKQGEIRLKSKCKIGSHSTLMPGVTIGENSIIGAHSFVTTDIPDNCVAVGVPAKIVDHDITTVSSGYMSNGNMKKRIFLAAPHMGGEELGFVHEAFDSNYIAPLGPQVDNFEKEFAEELGVRHAAAVSSGTAALHLSLRYAGVETGDEVICSSFTFVASANAIRYLGAVPVFIDSDKESWNMDPNLLSDFLAKRDRQGSIPKAMILVHLYGQPANLDPIVDLCNQYGVALIEDAAESLGATYKGKASGTFGRAGIFSFNGNKIITTSGGGMIVSDDEDLIKKSRYWATQARDPAPYYEHTELGYNYRMSNILAAIGRGQLRVLSNRVEQKRKIFNQYLEDLGNLPGVSFMPEPEFVRSSRWLTCLTINPSLAGIDRDTVIQELEKNNIEARPTWKPMHLQPLFRECEVVGGRISEELFKTGICLPSGTNMSEQALPRIIALIRNCWK